MLLADNLSHFTVSRNVCLGACKQKENKHSRREGTKANSGDDDSEEKAIEKLSFGRKVD